MSTVPEPGSKSSSIAWRLFYTLGNCLQLLAIGVACQLLISTWMSLLPEVESIAVILLVVSIAAKNSWFFLFSVLAILCVQDQRQVSMNTDLRGVLTTVTSLVLLTYASRIDVLREGFSCWLADSIIGRQADSSPTPRNQHAKDASSWSSIFAWWIRVGLGIASAIFAAWLAMRLITPLTRRSRLSRLISNGWEDIPWQFAVLVAVLIVAWLVVREFSWRQATPLQIRLACRSLLFKETHRDASSLGRRLVKRQHRERARAILEQRSKSER